MALQVTHATIAVGTDSGNGEIHKAEWNEAHSISMATNKLLGRSTAETGNAEEITIGSQLSLTGGILNVGTGIPVASSTMNTNKILGRTTASSGAVEEISVGNNLDLSSGSLNVSSNAIQNLEIITANNIGSEFSGFVEPQSNNLINTGLPIYEWGTQPNPWDVPLGAEILIHPNCLTGSGANTQCIKMRSDNVNWQFADGGQILYSKSGTIASPLVSGVAGTGSEANMWGGLNPIMIPAYMMYKGFRGRLLCTLIKTGTTALWDVWARIGKTAPGGSVTANDQLFTILSVASASGRQFQVDVSFVVSAAGRSNSGIPAISPGETAARYTTKLSLTPNGNGTSLATDKGSLFSTIDNQYININTKGGAGDTFALLDYTFIAMPI